METFVIILDLSYPMTEVLCAKCIEAIENALALAPFTRRTPFYVSLSTINHSVNHTIKLSNLVDNFATVSSSLAGIKLSDIEAHWPVTTLISCRDGRQVCDVLEGLYENLLCPLDSLLVLELKADAAHGSFSVCETRSGGAGGGPVARLVSVPAALAGAGVGAALEAALRAAWFTPRCGELQTVHLSLGGPRGHVLKCTAAECVLDPTCLPVADSFSLVASVGGVDLDGGGGGQCSRARLLRVVSRLAEEAVSEGSLFGMPIKLMWAPQAHLQWGCNEYQQNAHMFLALCQSLIEKDEYLLVKMQGQSQPEDLGGHFILMPGDECLLLRAVASAELVLPLPPTPTLQYDAAAAVRATREIQDALDGVPVVDHYLAKRHPAGLSRALTLNARFPQRLSLPRQPRRRASAGSVEQRQLPPLQVQEKAPTQQVSSDEEVELPEINVNKALVGPPPRGRRPAAPAASQGTSHGASLSDDRQPTHRLGTGGHPALAEHFPQPAKRKKHQLPPCVVVKRN